MEKELSREELKELISDLLKKESLCVIATCSDNIPRASTVEFFPIDTTLYIITEGGSKIDNILKNPRVSVAIHAPFKGWESVKGLQVTGNAEIGRSGSRIFEEGLEAYRRRRSSKDASLPDFMNVIKVIPTRIEYIDMALGKKGYKIRHILMY